MVNKKRTRSTSNWNEIHWENHHKDAFALDHKKKTIAIFLIGTIFYAFAMCSLVLLPLICVFMTQDNASTLGLLLCAKKDISQQVCHIPYISNMDDPVLNSLEKRTAEEIAAYNLLFNMNHILHSLYCILKWRKLFVATAVLLCAYLQWTYFEWLTLNLGATVWRPYAEKKNPGIVQPGPIEQGQPLCPAHMHACVPKEFDASRPYSLVGAGITLHQYLDLIEEMKEPNKAIMDIGICVANTIPCPPDILKDVPDSYFRYDKVNTPMLSWRLKPGTKLLSDPGRNLFQEAQRLVEPLYSEFFSQPYCPVGKLACNQSSSRYCDCDHNTLHPSGGKQFENGLACVKVNNCPRDRICHCATVPFQLQKKYTNDPISDTQITMPRILTTSQPSCTTQGYKTCVPVRFATDRSLMIYERRFYSWPISKPVSDHLKSFDTRLAYCEKQSIPCNPGTHQALEASTLKRNTDYLRLPGYHPQQPSCPLGHVICYYDNVCPQTYDLWPFELKDYMPAGSAVCTPGFQCPADHATCETNSKPPIRAEKYLQQQHLKTMHGDIKKWDKSKPVFVANLQFGGNHGSNQEIGSPQLPIIEDKKPHWEKPKKKDNIVKPSVPPETPTPTPKEEEVAVQKDDEKPVESEDEEIPPVESEDEEIPPVESEDEEIPPSESEHTSEKSSGDKSNTGDESEDETIKESTEDDSSDKSKQESEHSVEEALSEHVVLPTKTPVVILPKMTEPSEKEIVMSETPSSIAEIDPQSVEPLEHESPQDIVIRGFMFKDGYKPEDLIALKPGDAIVLQDKDKVELGGWADGEDVDIDSMNASNLPDNTSAIGHSWGGSVVETSRSKVCVKSYFLSSPLGVWYYGKKYINEAIWLVGTPDNECESAAALIDPTSKDSNEIEGKTHAWLSLENNSGLNNFCLNNDNYMNLLLIHPMNYLNSEVRFQCYTKNELELNMSTVADSNILWKYELVTPRNNSERGKISSISKLDTMEPRYKRVLKQTEMTPDMPRDLRRKKIDLIEKLFKKKFVNAWLQPFLRHCAMGGIFDNIRCIGCKADNTTRSIKGTYAYCLNSKIQHNQIEMICEDKPFLESFDFQNCSTPATSDRLSLPEVFEKEIDNKD